MAQPEKIGIWDRFFNRKRKEIVEQGKESWQKIYSNSNLNIALNQAGKAVPDSSYERCFVIYKIIDRVTGSETIEKEYLN